MGMPRPRPMPKAMGRSLSFSVAIDNVSEDAAAAVGWLEVANAEGNVANEENESVSVAEIMLEGIAAFVTKNGMLSTEQLGESALAALTSWN